MTPILEKRFFFRKILICIPKFSLETIFSRKTTLFRAKTDDPFPTTCFHCKQVCSTPDRVECTEPPFEARRKQPRLWEALIWLVLCPSCLHRYCDNGYLLLPFWWFVCSASFCMPAKSQPLDFPQQTPRNNTRLHAFFFGCRFLKQSQVAHTNPKLRPS